MLFRFDTLDSLYGCLDILKHLIDDHGFVEVELLEELEQYCRSGVFSMDILKGLAEQHYPGGLSIDGWKDLDDVDIFGFGSYYFLSMPEPSKNDLDEIKGFCFYGVSFKTYDEAEYVLNSMIEILNKYGYVTVADFYDLVNIPVVYSDITRGWTDLSIAHAMKDEDEKFNLYYCYLPEPHDVTNEVRNSYFKGCLNAKFGAQKSQDNDLVNHPQHYRSKSGLEVIDAIEAFTEELQGIEAVDTANIIKYICRWKKKNGLQDLEKAQWYLNNLIEYVKENENEDVR